MKEEYEVVISGMSGKFPNCSEVDELKQSLFEKINLITDEGRWKANEMDVPHQVGIKKDPYAFDLTYFGVARKVAEFMDPNTKNIMECAIAAVHDAGVSLNDIAGSNTATIASSTIHETECDISSSTPRKLSILMYANCMETNRIAYFMDLRGPSFVCLSDWNGGLYVLQHARKLIATGLAKAAIVATSSSMFQPQVSYHFNRMGRLNNDGKTKCFSNDADGYTRSEACVVFFLQRKEDAVRSYGTIVGVEISAHGSKPGSCADCSKPVPSIIKSVYETTNIDPTCVAYLEATGSASKVVDAQELNSISDIFLSNRKDPLLIGSVKSNLGHTEAAASFVGIVKMLLASETGMIPPNLHYSIPNQKVPALLSGRLKVVTEATPLEGDFLAINNLSAFGSHGHALIKRNTKTKKRQCQVGVLPPDGIPRLVLLSGRDEDKLNKVMDNVQNMPIDEEFIALTHLTFAKGIKNHMYRGYTVLHEGKNSKVHRKVQAFASGEGRRPLWLVFSGMGSQWPAMGAKLMVFPPFAKAIQACHSLLKQKGVDLIDTITNPSPEAFKDILKCFVGITAIQIGLIDVLKEIGIEADGIVGHSVGEVGCSYFDGSLTAEQAIMGSYLRGKISADSKISGGLMAAVGKGYNQLKDIVPDGIDIACRNSSTSCTISGPAELVEEFMESLSEKGVFVRSVPSGGIAYHSRYIQQIGKIFEESYKKVVPNPMPRSSKWISSSIPEERWDSDLAKYSSAEYHAHNLLNPVLFEDAMEHIPKDAIIIEVAPRGLLKAILQRAIPSATYVPLTAVGDEGDITLLSAFGRLYNEGINFKIEKLYPPIEFPVSRGTPSLSPLFTWLRNETFKKWAFLDKQKIFLTRRKLYFNHQNSNKYDFSDCKLNDTPFVPAATYLDLIIDMFKEAMRNPFSRILFEDITFGKIAKYGGEKPVYGALQSDIGHWEFTLKSRGLATGSVELYYPKVGSPFEKIKPSHVPNETFSKDQIYDFLTKMGLSLNKKLRNIECLSINESNTSVCADILWTDDWIVFFDSALTLLTFFNSLKNNNLLFVKKIRQLFIDFNEFKLEKNQVLKVYYNSDIELLWTNGFELHLPLMRKPIIENSMTRNVDFRVPRFFAFESTSEERNSDDFFDICVRIIVGNMAMDDKVEEKLQVYFESDNMDMQQDFFNILKKSYSKAAVASLPNNDALICAESICMKNKYCLILNEKNDIDKLLPLLQKSQAGFLISKTEIFNHNFVLIMKQKLGENTFFLYKTLKVCKEQKTVSYVLFTPKQWESDLKDKLASTKCDIVYLVGPSASVNQMQEIVQRCTSFQQFKKIRFLFLENYSEFNSGKYEEQLIKDLKILVLKDQLWGTLLLDPLKLSAPLELVPYCKEFLYRFNTIKIDGIQLCTLGLNFTDLTEERNKLGVFEFSGMRNGKEVCGLASLEERTGILEADSVLVWDKPPGWSHEDIVTSLLAYSMAYHILELEIDHPYLNSILVHNGELPLSQAILRLALKRGYEVYTTYDGGLSKKNLIAALIAEIPEDNILKMDLCLYENLMMRSDGKGVQIVVNTVESEKMILPTAKNLKNKIFNKIYQLSSRPTRPGQNIGMYCLAKNICMKGFGPDCFLNLHKDDKKIIWKLIEEGFRNKEIIPFGKTIISSSSFNVDALPQMKKINESGKKLVVAMNEGFIVNEMHNGLFDCQSQKICIIIGHENSIFFDLIQWHMNRGCRKFIIAANISPLLTKRLSILITENDHLNLNLCSSEPFTTPELAHSFIKLIQQTEQIETLFVFGKEYCSALGDLYKSLIDTKMIFIGKDLEMSAGVCCSPNHLAITFSNDECELTAVIENLDSLLKLSEPVLYLNEYSSNNSGFEKTYLRHWEHIPISEEEMVHLAASSKYVSWREVRTSSPPYSSCKDVPPVFVIPPLKKGKLDRLLKELFYPAFKAIIPESFKTFDGLAQELFKELDKFNTDVVTLICADWSYHLGLSLGHILEENGKVVCLIFLGLSNSWADLGVLNSIYPKVCKTLVNGDSKVRNSSERGFRILQERIKLVANTSIQATRQFEGFCHIITNDQPDDILLNELKKVCKRTVKVHFFNEGDYSEMINSYEVANIINASVLIEHKDRARNVARDYNIFESIRSG